MNKIFTLLAAAGLAMSANATVLWEGSFDMGDGNNEFKECSVDGDEWTTKYKAILATATEESNLVFTYEGVSTDEANPGQIELVVKPGANWKWTDLLNWVNINGTTVTYALDDVVGDYTVLEVMQDRGFYVKGKNATLVKIEILGKGEAGEGGEGGGVTPPVTPGGSTVLWEGSFDMGDGNAEFLDCSADGKEWTTKYKAILATATEESKLVFTYENVSTDAANPGQIELVIKPGANWKWTDLVNWANIKGTTYTYALDDVAGDYTVLEVMQDRGFIVKGKNATLVKIEIVTGKVTPPAGSDVLWEGSFDMGDGNNEFNECFCEGDNWASKVEPALAGATEDSKLRFTYTDVSTDPENPGQIELVIKTGAGWKWTDLLNWVDIKGNTVTYALDDVAGDYTVLEVMQERGFIVKGKNATLVKVELVNEGAGVEDVTVDTAIDLNAPVEIYTIDGRRVNEMTQGRIYIVRQGNKVAKIAK